MSEATKEAKKRLESMLEEIDSTAKTANRDLSGHDPRTVTGMISRQRQAKDELKQLISGYNTLIRNSFVNVFVTGSRARDFAAAADEDGVIVVSGRQMYEEFANAVEPSMDPKTRQFTSTQVILLMQVMQRWMETNAIGSLAQPRLSANEMDVAAKGFDDVVDRVRLAIESGNGTAMLGRDLEIRITKKALEKKAAAMIVPVIITGLTGSEIADFKTTLFSGRPSLEVEADEDSTDEQLIDVINTKILQLFGKKQ